ncbi:phospho-2-dehydro-3-deoxyheptonate aldolase [Gemmatimonas aurantiaca T-27]|uniref:Phospho-2-dehydro-3-deoxyheptonate aldolase n=2 Tax=Gemmatimonas aurantiaca TaxID=173480 RepID=C1ACN1_GEMAT|nr:3-deoxy-7-phosphoheptulonate synthase [Gemmatimonas aurantiaca]BAH40258.1 phospho-2-dehydro-3-deoxyheptonate aldolase [Gemmatimonas aurantiaca T-27]
MVDALPTPHALRDAVPLSDATQGTVERARADIREILHGADRRWLVVVGPCSVHDVDAAREYAAQLHALQQEVSSSLLLVMRVYVEKPRTRLGWTGLLHDPGLDGSGRVNDGLRIARALFEEINAMGLPVATEFVDPVVADYLQDLVAWSAIGARTVESPLHRQMASGLACPVGFKNSTSGDVTAAINGMISAGATHRVLTIDDDGRAAVRQTPGNPDTHLILRGGTRPNADRHSVHVASAAVARERLVPRVMIDCGHGNAGPSGAQTVVLEDIIRRVQGRNEDMTHVLGIMLESHLEEGRQLFVPGVPMRPGQSITDACVSLEDTRRLLRELARALG